MRVLHVQLTAVLSGTVPLGLQLLMVGGDGRTENNATKEDNWSLSRENNTIKDDNWSLSREINTIKEDNWSLSS